MIISHVAKFKKYHKQRIRIRSVACKLREPIFGTFAIRAKEAGRLAEWHFETVQKTFRRSLRKMGHIWFLGNPTIPVSAKPTNIRMGKGKGAVAFWSQMVPTGAVMAEVGGQNRDFLARAIKGASKKIPNKISVSWARVKLHK